MDREARQFVANDITFLHTFGLFARLMPRMSGSLAGGPAAISDGRPRNGVCHRREPVVVDSQLRQGRSWEEEPRDAGADVEVAAERSEERKLACKFQKSPRTCDVAGCLLR